MPLAAQPDKRLLGGRERPQLVLGQLDVADRESPVERGDRAPRQQAAGEAGRSRRDEVHAHAARRHDPCARQANGDVELLEPRHRVPKERAHRIAVELDARRWVAVEHDPRVREDRFDRRQAALERATRVTVSEEPEHVVGAVLEQRRREGEGGVVRRLEPELEHDRRRLAVGRARFPVLVEAEPEIPGCPRAVCQAAVHPRADAALERQIAGAGGKLRRRGRQAREEKRGRDLPAGVTAPGARPPRGAAPVARARRLRSRRGRRRRLVCRRRTRRQRPRARRGRSCRARRGRARRASRPRAHASARRPPPGAGGRARPRPSAAPPRAPRALRVRSRRARDRRPPRRRERAARRARCGGRGPSAPRGRRRRRPVAPRRGRPRRVRRPARARAGTRRRRPARESRGSRGRLRWRGRARTRTRKHRRGGRCRAGEARNRRRRRPRRGSPAP